jgi:hypothetical protein
VRRVRDIVYRSYAYRDEGRVKINPWPKAVMKIRPAA